MARLYTDPTSNPNISTALTAAQRAGSITTPPQQDFDTPAMEGSMQQFLAENLGQYVVVEFLMGTRELTTKAGVIYAVGTSVLTLYQELSQTFVTCDIFSIKFVTFYLPGHRPWQLNYPMVQPGTGTDTGMGTGTPGGTMAPGFMPSVDMTQPTGAGTPAQRSPGFAQESPAPAWG